MFNIHFFLYKISTGFYIKFFMSLKIKLKTQQLLKVYYFNI